MGFDWSGRWGVPYFDLTVLRPEGYLLLSVYLVALFISFYLRWRDFRSLNRQHWIEGAFFLGATVLLSNLFWLRFPIPDGLTPPDLPIIPRPIGIPLLIGPLLMLAGVRLGAGPAMALGVLSGLVQGGLDSSRIFQPFEGGLLGLTAGFLLCQDYRGWLFRAVRQPILTGLAAATLVWTLQLPNTYVSTGGSSLSALDYAWSLQRAYLPPLMLQGLFSGLVVQFLYALIPTWKPRRWGQEAPPHARSMSRRLLIVFVPLTMVMVVILFSAVTTTAIRVATTQAIAQMSRDATNASVGIPFFFQMGQGLMVTFASDERLQEEDPAILQQWLAQDLRTVAFFHQLVLFDSTGTEIARYPSSEEERLPLSLEEETLLERVIRTGAPQISAVHRSPEGDAVISFLAPLEGEGPPYRVLLGRTRPEINPVLVPVMRSLQWTMGRGSGFLMDDRRRIVIHPDSGQVLTVWQQSVQRREITKVPVGQAYQDLDYNGTRRLVYVLPVEGSDWQVVITLPYEVVLDAATQTSKPLLALLLALGVILVVTIPVVTQRLTQPLTALSQAAARIAEGELSARVQLEGEDEVGQLGKAFERMRIRLKRRMEDLNLLLRVSQAVSATLDLREALPPILQGSLQVTQARQARLIFLSQEGEPQWVMARGEGGGRLTGLDRMVARLALQADGPVLLENLTRPPENPRIARFLQGVSIPPQVRAAIVLPMRIQERTVGVLWLAYDHIHRFSASEVDFLSTLASQGAVAIENARLFQAAEGGRRRLEAILASTSDAIIVTDQLDRLLLINPAAEELFGISGEEVHLRPVQEVIDHEAVVRLLTEPMDGRSALTDEVPMPDGRTFYASCSTIVSGDGQTIGRVVLMRDITYLKELDEMKSEFVATVSHDLRAPLTFMRGYATMIPMVGQVTPKQQTYVEKIIAGIEQMTELIDDLLDLGRIEAGVGLMRERCDLGEIAAAVVEDHRVQAVAKGLSLSLEPPVREIQVIGDQALLRHAIANLVENAIKYTPSGSVTVGVTVRSDRAVVSVADTGIGIAPADQVRLFEKFYRIKRRDTLNIKGSGLGLAIVKSIAERHGGRVWVESQLDVGSTFYFEVPLPTAEELAALEEEEAAEVEGDGATRERDSERVRR